MAGRRFKSGLQAVVWSRARPQGKWGKWERSPSPTLFSHYSHFSGVNRAILVNRAMVSGWREWEDMARLAGKWRDLGFCGATTMGQGLTSEVPYGDECAS